MGFHYILNPLRTASIALDKLFLGVTLYLIQNCSIALEEAHDALDNPDFLSTSMIYPG